MKWNKITLEIREEVEDEEVVSASEGGVKAKNR